MRKHGRKDGNQDEVVAALRQIGAAVTVLSQVGNGCPDILVCFRGTWYPIEIKDGSRKPSEQRLTGEEAAWWLAAQQAGSGLYVARDVMEAFRIIGATPYD